MVVLLAFGGIYLQLVKEYGKNWSLSQLFALYFSSTTVEAETPLTKEKKPAKKYSHGFSYVRSFKAMNIVISTLVGLAIGVGGLEETSGFSIVIGLLVPFLLYWILTFPIKMFENIAIIAKNSTEILNRMNNTK